MMLFVFQVRKSEVAVITLFGKVDHVNDKPGPGFRLPWPIETVYKLDQRIQNFEGKYDPITLPDQNIIMLLTYVGWQIEDPPRSSSNLPGRLHFAGAEKGTGGFGAQRQERSRRAASVFRFSFGGPGGDEIDPDRKRNPGQGSCSRLKAGDYGIDIKFVQIKKIELPETVTQDCL